jgi:hypothetical protein
MIRRCELCGSEKRGAEAEFKSKGIIGHDAWWAKMHNDGCEYLKITETTTYVMEHGSPLSSVVEE